MKEQNGGITIADAMNEGFKDIETWSVTKQALVKDVQESYTGDRPRSSHLNESAVPNKKGNGKRYVRRDAEGGFKESNDQGRSLARDVQQHAKTIVKSGQGDRGDQERK
jgi:hypothetical protein